MKTPRKPPAKRKSDVTSGRLASRPVRPSAPGQGELDLAPMPKWIEPCIPQVSARVPAGEMWLYEIKFDGFRCSIHIDHGQVTIFTRNGHDWTRRFPAIAAAAALLRVESAIIDGEAVMLDDRGRSRYADLHAAAMSGFAPDAVLYAFDLLWLNGEDLREKSLADRRLELDGLGLLGGPIIISEEWGGDGAEFFKHVCANELEGVVAKRRDKPYRSGRRPEWLKIKCVHNGDFKVIGYFPSTSVPGAVASLLLATPDKSAKGHRLRFVGSVGSGLSVPLAVSLRAVLDDILLEAPPVAGLAVAGAIWCEPRLTIDVAYRGLTQNGQLRHASFRGLSGSSSGGKAR